MKPVRQHPLVDTHPQLVKQWHPTANDIEPGDFSAGSEQSAWWKCEHGHEWRQPISSRTREGHGDCGYCSGRLASPENNLALTHPEIAAMWHPSLNNGTTPEEVLPGSDFVATWVCRHGHIWRTRVFAMTRYGGRCRVCIPQQRSGESTAPLSVTHPEIAAQWHPTRNSQGPDEVTYGSGMDVVWQCSKRHAWTARVRGRTVGKTGCPFCSGRYASPENNLAISSPALAKQWHPTKNSCLTPDQVTPRSHKAVWWQCANGHEWQTAINSRVSRNSQCPHC